MLENAVGELQEFDLPFHDFYPIESYGKDHHRKLA